jgi:hypothetical protein
MTGSKNTSTAQQFIKVLGDADNPWPLFFSKQIYHREVISEARSRDDLRSQRYLVPLSFNKLS